MSSFSKTVLTALVALWASAAPVQTIEEGLEQLLHKAAPVATSLVHQAYTHSSPLQQGGAHLITLLDPEIRMVSTQDPATYDTLLDSLRQEREALYDEPLEDYQAFLEDALEKITDCWYGTEWHFSGIAAHPERSPGPRPHLKEDPDPDRIACGHFVARTLHDLGYNIDAPGLGKQVYDNIIKTMTDPTTYRWFSHQPVSTLEAYCADHGDGWYIIGLSNHGGFLHAKDGDIDFVHSRYLFPQVVTREPVEQSAAISVSDCMVVGKLFSPVLTRTYQRGAYIPVYGGGE